MPFSATTANITSIKRTSKLCEPTDRGNAFNSAHPLAKLDGWQHVYQRTLKALRPDHPNIQLVNLWDPLHYGQYDGLTGDEIFTLDVVIGRGDGRGYSDDPEGALVWALIQYHWKVCRHPVEHPLMPDFEIYAYHHILDAALHGREGARHLIDRGNLPVVAPPRVSWGRWLG